MPSSLRPGQRFPPSLPLVLLGILFATLLIGGGASRADALGQILVRGVAWILLIVAALFMQRPSFQHERPILLLLGAAVLLALLQLVPLPPSVWRALPGREAMTRAASAVGDTQPWRPWAIVPGAAMNSASSLIVPIATLVLMSGLREVERAWIPSALLALIVASTLIGLLQFSGINVDNPLINDSIGQVSGTFANRNHFATIMAIGCLLAPAWAFPRGRPAGWRGPCAVGLVLFFVLMILATGSRAGTLTGAVALGVAALLASRGLRRMMAGRPRWLSTLIIVTIIAVIIAFVFVSVVADRAQSINRVFDVEISTDMRSRALPTVLTMIRTYFPAGSGLGGFDPIFRIHEPFALLKLSYFNHAHNDFLEIVLDAGLPGLLLVTAGVLWWAGASVRAWRGVGCGDNMLPKLGSAMLLLVMIASVFDYPARTPIILAVSVMAGIWLCDRSGGRTASSLLASGQRL